MTKFQNKSDAPNEERKGKGLPCCIATASLLALAFIGTVIGIANGIELTLPALFGALAAMLVTTTYLAGRLIRGLATDETDLMTTPIPVQRTITKP